MPIVLLATLSLHGFKCSPGSVMMEEGPVGRTRQGERHNVQIWSQHGYTDQGNWLVIRPNMYSDIIRLIGYITEFRSVPAHFSAFWVYTFQFTNNLILLTKWGKRGRRRPGGQWWGIWEICREPWYWVMWHWDGACLAVLVMGGRGVV